MVLTCKWKWCKKILKVEPSKAAELMCTNPKCENQIHQACFDDLVSVFCDGQSFEAAVCGKRCLNAMRKATKVTPETPSSTKKRVAWHNDGPTPSISSVSCLIDWMTEGSNYERYRGGDAQRGETKTTIAGEIVRFISDCGVTTPRSAKDIQTKIASLEQMYKSAVDWLGATGQGVTDEKSIHDALIYRCPYYYELDDVMKDRATTNPLLLNTANLDSSDDSDEEEDSASQRSADNGDDTGSAGGVVTTASLTQTDENEAVATHINLTSPQLHVDFSTGKGATNGQPKPKIHKDRKRPASTPRSIESAPKKVKADAGDMATSSPLVELKKLQLAQDKEFQLQSLQIERAKAESTAQEARARVEESAARIVHLRAQADTCTLDRKVNLLRERNKLCEEGVPQSEIDALLPLLRSDFEEIVE